MVALAAGATIAEVCRRTDVCEVTCYGWRQGYGGMRVEQAGRLAELEAENAGLRTAVSDLTLDKILREEAAVGSPPAPVKPCWQALRAADGP